MFALAPVGPVMKAQKVCTGKHTHTHTHAHTHTQTHTCALQMHTLRWSLVRKNDTF